MSPGAIRKRPEDLFPRGDLAPYMWPELCVPGFPLSRSCGGRARLESGGAAGVEEARRPESQTHLASGSGPDESLIPLSLGFPLYKMGMTLALPRCEH